MSVQVPTCKWTILTGKTLSAREMAGWKIKINTILQRNPSFGETPDQVHFSYRKLCWKVTNYDVHTSFFNAPRISEVGLCAWHAVLCCRYWAVSSTSWCRMVTLSFNSSILAPRCRYLNVLLCFRGFAAPGELMLLTLSFLSPLVKLWNW